mmetsp:Transcript_9866/g.10650  ORF Transcript_9866/g.10650 Transcript_9866/m.10650 type:complete len:399 (-) Transcript_9866:555-1751(-)
MFKGSSSGKFAQFQPSENLKLQVQTVPLNDIRRKLPKKLEELMNNANAEDLDLTELCSKTDELKLVMYCEDSPSSTTEPIYCEIQSLPAIHKYLNLRLQTVPDGIFTIEKSQIYKSTYLPYSTAKKRKRGSEIHCYFTFIGSVISEFIWKNAQTSLEMNLAVDSLALLAHAASQTFTDDSSVSVSASSSSNPPISSSSSSSFMSQVEDKAESLNKRKREEEETGDDVTDYSGVSLSDSRPKKLKSSPSKILPSTLSDESGSLKNEVEEEDQEIVAQYYEDHQKTLDESRPVSVSASTTSLNHIIVQKLEPIQSSSTSACHEQRVSVGHQTFLVNDSTESTDNLLSAFRSTAIATKDTEFSMGGKIAPIHHFWKGVIILQLDDEHKIHHLIVKYLTSKS